MPALRRRQPFELRQPTHVIHEIGKPDLHSRTCVSDRSKDCLPHRGHLVAKDVSHPGPDPGPLAVALSLGAGQGLVPPGALLQVIGDAPLPQQPGVCLGRVGGIGPHRPAGVVLIEQRLKHLAVVGTGRGDGIQTGCAGP